MSAIRCLWLVGCGNMAGAMLRGWIAGGVIEPADVFVVNRQDRDLPAGVAQGRAFPEGPPPDAVMLGMKPFQLDEIAATHGARIAGVPLLLSILAGVEEATLAARFSAGAVVRAMPNLPVAIGKGVVPLHSSAATADQRRALDTLMAPLGLVEWIDESLFDVAAAVAGSGPGFLYRFIDALAAAGVAQGLSPEQAQRFAVATVEGSGLLAAAADVSPAVLADRVASPRGSTREGYAVLDHDDALQRLIGETIAAAVRRNAEMAAEARG
ncbi:pyrroline-5-carboxylate reductase family protein [Sphingomonas sp.]|uniref:pyrroline-5-carboxylate reductase family protein n=1 Tax=Sphingomonas sp. TaxID=28214 RepID=UPI002C3BA0D2|nr:pyrroline-5-carboxylate reductase dimerization domain-containing protein [Sphingomonas sp.]HWK35960.1 pyrroline-5-carboxylate reductase dimerization domain-containing protein [Sphingomonas sp.]